MKKQSPLKRIFAIRGMGGALTAFAGPISDHHLYRFWYYKSGRIFRSECNEPVTIHVKVSDHWYWSELCADHR